MTCPPLCRATSGVIGDSGGEVCPRRWSNRRKRVRRGPPVLPKPSSAGQQFLAKWEIAVWGRRAVTPNALDRLPPHELPQNALSKGLVEILSPTQVPGVVEEHLFLVSTVVVEES